jgi:hypothetical protein
MTDLRCIGVHQFFMTDQSLFVLVIDASVETLPLDNIRFWLNSIRFRTNQLQSTIIVASKCESIDSPDASAALADKIEQIEQCIRETNSSDWVIGDIIQADFRTDRGVDEIRERLVRAAPLIVSRWDQAQPLRWVRLEELIRLIASPQIDASSQRATQTRLVGYLEMERVRQIASLECGIPSEEVASAIKFLVKIGSLMRFDHSASSSSSITRCAPVSSTRDDNGRRSKLSDYVFCSPQWLVDAMKCLVNIPTRFHRMYRTQ